MTKPRVSREQVASSTNPTPKRTKRAGSKRLATPQNWFSDDQTAVDMQTISKKNDALLRVVTDLTMRVSVFKERQDQGEASVRASPPTFPPRRRARRQVTHTPIDELAPDIRRHVAERLKRAISLNPDTQDEAMSDEEEHLPEAECIRKGHPT